MKKLSLAAICAVVLMCFLGFSAPVKADQEIVVVPLSFDFGNVEIGMTSTNVITVFNDGDQYLIIYEVKFEPGSDAEFSFTPPPEYVAANSSVDINIEFTPSSEGFFMAVLAIISNDVDEGTVFVGLSGVGNGGVTPPVSVAEILAFFDASVADGTLIGNGPGNSADGRLNALRNQIEAAGDLIDGGYIDEACQQLLDAYQRCDGLPRPPEFVAGDAAQTLAVKILDLMGALGCP
jgi:hypothetical protein